MAILTYPLNGILYNAEDVEAYLCTRTSGVYAAENNFALEITGAMQVTIGKGIAWIRNEEFAGKVVKNDTGVALTIPIADGLLNRIDRIVIQFDKSANATKIVLKQGTAANFPIAPEIVRDGVIYELGLYEIAVNAGLVEIADENITNTMRDETVCGLMRDAVTSAMPNHAPNHAIGGRDPLSPDQIGAVAKPTEIAKSDSVIATIANNTEYTFTDVTSLNIAGNIYNAHGFVTFGSSTPSVSITGFNASGGDNVAEAKASEIWEFSCDNGYIIWKNWSA